MQKSSFRLSSAGMEQLRQQHQQAKILQQAQKKQLQPQYQCYKYMQFPPTTFQSNNTILQQPMYPNHPLFHYVYHQQQQMASKPMTTQNIQRQGNKRKRQDVGQVTMPKVAESIPPANGKPGGNPNNQSKPSPNKKSGSLLVESGLPTDILGEGLEWPKGWTKIKKQRLGGASAGTFDCYWISPVIKHRLRSLPEVRRFLRALQANGGDEVLAKQIFKRKKPKQEKTQPSKDQKPALKGGKSPKSKIQRSPKPSLQTPPSSTIGVSANKLSSVAQNSPHLVVTKKARVSNPKTNVAVTKSKTNGVPIVAARTSHNIQTVMKHEPMPTPQAALAVAAKTSELTTLAEKSPDAMATGTAPEKKQQEDSQQQRNGQLSQQQQKQDEAPSPDAQEGSPEFPFSGQNQGSSIVSGDSDDFGGKIGFAEYHIEL